jgi:hypothetical protein
MSRFWKPVTLLITVGAIMISMSCAEAKPVQPEEFIPADTISVAVETVEEEVEYLEDTAVFRLTDYERDLVERIVASEARGESLECQMAVAQTIKDRCYTREQTIVEVCLAPYQFAAPYEGEVSDMVKDAVRFTFDDGESVLEYPTTHFYAWKLIEPPYWTADKEFRGQIDGTRFYGDKEE